MPASRQQTPARPPTPVVPRSASSFLLDMLGFSGGLAVIMALIAWGPRVDAWIGPLPQGMGSVSSNHLLIAMVGCAVVFLVVGGGELLVHRSYRKASTGLNAVPLRAGEVLVSLLSIVGAGLVMFTMVRFDPLAAVYEGLPQPLTLVIDAAAAAIAGLWLFTGGARFWRRNDGLAQPWNMGRIATKLFGLLLTLGLIALVYWLFPEYHGSFYDPFWGFLEALLWPFALLLVPYFAWTDMRLAEPRDSYWHLGYLPFALLNDKTAEIDGAALKSHFMGWTVKAFFLALMAVYLPGEVRSLANAYGGLWNETPNVYQFLYDLSYMVDLLFCVVGYTFTLRLFDSHIRSTEPTAFGWLIALVCYQPFYSTIGNMYLRYDDNLYWDNWLSTLTPWQVVNNGLHGWWAGMICVLLFAYALATVSFGLRFSNLTYRGIITSGPYRFSKHPAYISKNLSWWLISIPFISHEHWYEAVRNSCLLALLNLIYYLRARTEESHLSLRDPDYVRYALWMEEHGMLAWLGRLFPFLRYKPPAGAVLPEAARG